MNKWNDLTMKEKAALIKVGVANGFRDIDSIRDQYNSFADGGDKPTLNDIKEVIDTSDKDKEAYPFDNGGHLYELGDWLSNLFKSNNTDNTTTTPKTNTSFKRVHPNNSPTKEASEAMEDRMNKNLKGHNSTYDHKWDIPYIDSKEIKILGNRVSSNALDSLAKYAVKTGVPIEEAVGLALYESTLGGTPFINMKDYPENATPEQKAEVDAHNRALGNSSFFRNYGYIPAWAIVRDNEWVTEGYNKTKKQKESGMAPLEHSMLLYKSGLYNPGLGQGKHTKEVKKKAEAVKRDKNYIKWLEGYNSSTYYSGGPLDILPKPLSYGYRPDVLY